MTEYNKLNRAYKEAKSTWQSADKAYKVAGKAAAKAAGLDQANFRNELKGLDGNKLNRLADIRDERSSAQSAIDQANELYGHGGDFSNLEAADLEDVNKKLYEKAEADYRKREKERKRRRRNRRSGVRRGILR